MIGGLAYASEKRRRCEEEIGPVRAKALAHQCLQVSTATSPPCNPRNACSTIRTEIARGCSFIVGPGSVRPAFCAAHEPKPKAPKE